MRAGKGRKHGRYYLGDSVIDTASTPTLSQIRARTVSGGPSIRERPTATQALQAQLDEERARREQLEATLAQQVQAQVQAQLQAQPMPGSAGSKAGAGAAPVQDVDLSAVRNLFPNVPPPFDP
ncbi:hypothetical protein EJB05_45281 [Eragrostis curvula]|uniref:Uncharacterized protein n=1 Tax=Eragrostis curvula TaxID=38414 RepID=A0A5J9TLY6_9POAL|nr:hypothetical protein EJB05_45281 [Eragrostis curvula]